MSNNLKNGYGGLTAVVTGGGTGMGRELVRQLTEQGCNVATCDVNGEALAETVDLCMKAGNSGKILTHIADVSDEAQVLSFRDAVAAWTPHIHVLFNNAGIGGGGSFTEDPRDGWEKTFNVCWGGVYLNARAFIPLLLAAPFGHLVNTSSINGFWASLGPTVSHSAYSAAKFAVKGFTEALITDFRNNAPHLSAHVVMPGHIGTDIAINSGKLHGNDPKEMSGEQIEKVRSRFERQGVDMSSVSDEDLRVLLQMGAEGFRDNAPTSAADASKYILDCVARGDWRILVGADAQIIDDEVRKDPWTAYELSFIERVHARGALGGIVAD
jgi:NAD(P)-dependent dehydrogenase (short-subunit alcohol dehydrogenase family)